MTYTENILGVDMTINGDAHFVSMALFNNETRIYSMHATMTFDGMSKDDIQSVIAVMADELDAIVVEEVNF